MSTTGQTETTEATEAAVKPLDDATAPPPVWRQRPDHFGDEPALSVQLDRVMHLTFAIEADPPPGLARPEMVTDPSRAILAELLSTGPGRELHARFHRLRAEAGAAYRRRVAVKVRLTKLTADREMAEAEAGPNLGKRLVALDKLIEAARADLAVAEEEEAAVEPPRDAARKELVLLLDRAIPGLLAGAERKLKEMQAAAKAEVLRVLTSAASAELLELFRLEATAQALPQFGELHTIAVALMDQPPAEAPGDDKDKEAGAAAVLVDAAPEPAAAAAG